ncbi:MAG TPA: hypothetical protein VKS03_09510, partial [Thermoanaerobaculia bacterium]|nr:hypothetical protein [Thermoanaerobaculia bacterium]
HFHEGDPIRVRILRIDEGEMKIGLSGVDEGGKPLGAPEASATPAETPSEPEAESASVPQSDAGESVEGEAAPKKRRVRKKADEPKA